MSSDLIDTTEMYLRTILELEEEGIVPLRARISQRLNHSGPTVSQTIARMERDGLVVVTEDRSLELTDEGRTKAIRVMRKHRLAERLLNDVIGLPWEFVHDEACRWEHVMSDRVEKRLLDLLDHPTRSPYGNPIPGLQELTGSKETAFHVQSIDAVTLLDEADTETVQARILKLAEPLQVDPELLVQLQEAEILPGNTAVFEMKAQLVAVSVVGSDITLELSRETAAHIFVEHF